MTTSRYRALRLGLGLALAIAGGPGPSFAQEEVEVLEPGPLDEPPGPVLDDREADTGNTVKLQALLDRPRLSALHHHGRQQSQLRLRRRDAKGNHEHGEKTTHAHLQCLTAGHTAPIAGFSPRPW